METLDEVEEGSGSLPNPELYIMVNGKPTKNKVVWRSMVDVNKIKAALSKLREINVFYMDVDENSVDSAAKEVIEVVSDTSSKLLEKATESEIAGFQSYTVRDMNNKLSTDLDIEQFKLLSVQEAPLDSRQKYLDVLCFPVLFPDGNFGKYHPRKEKLSHSEYEKSRLWNKDGRFRKDMQYIFYLLKQKEAREISSGVYNVLKASKSVARNVSDLLHRVDSGDQQLESNLSTMFQNMRGTKQFWFKKRGELRTMLREFGPVSLFLTFSCAEYESPDITEYLRKMNKEVPRGYSISKLCTEDPVSVSRQFSHKFHVFFKTLILKGQILGIVDHYYWKKEYQARGAPHYHVLLWIFDAPVMGSDDPDKVIAWIEEHITCQIPDAKENPMLSQYVTRYQMHKCTNYCRKKRKLGNIFVTRCKSGFPREAHDKTVLNDMDTKLKRYQRVYEIARSESEARVNDYNPALLLNWGANMDIQYVGDVNMVISNYVTGYCSKAERCHMQEQFSQIMEEKNLCGQLFKFCRDYFKSREIGAYEAVDHILGDHLSEQSDPVLWVDVQMPHKRTRRLKNHEELLKVRASNPMSEDIFVDNVLSTYYPQRPQELEGVCFHDFLAQYEWRDKDEKTNKRKYRKLTKQKLVQHKYFDPAKPEERESYFHSLILLFVPFRDESTLLKENETAEQAFHRQLPSNSDCSEYHERLQKMLKAEAHVREIEEARRQANSGNQKDEANNDNNNLDDANGLNVHGEEIEAMLREVQAMDENQHDTLTLEKRVDMLNSDQRRVFDNVKCHLLHQQKHESNQCQCNNFKPLCTFISGVGGTGKSFLIEAIKSLTNSVWDHESKLRCAVTAPTGFAAYHISGVTLHRLLQLPIEHDGKEAGYWSLCKAVQKVLKTKLSNLKLLIIDEVSMVSNLNLAYIHMRLQELFGGEDWFGGLNIVFVGDLLQLPPVCGEPIFENMTQSTITKKLGCLATRNIWLDCVMYDELTINERQKSDERFSQLLNSVRLGEVSEETLSVLKDRVFDRPVCEKIQELKRAGKNPVCLFPTRKQCDEINYQMLAQLDADVQVIACCDEVDDRKSTAKWQEKAAKQLEKLNQDCNNTAGLEAVLKLAVGARVMLRRNINVEAGLVNGAIGTVLGIHEKRISVKFDHLDKPFDVEKVTGKFMVSKTYYVYRTQFPLILAYAVTIHKCQGLSLDCAVVDISEKVFASGMAYVALSRVRSLEGLHIAAFHPSSTRVSTKCLREINRLRKLYRNDLPQYRIPNLRKRSLSGKCIGEGEPPAKKPAPNKRQGTKRENSSVTPAEKKPRLTDQPGSSKSKQKKVWPCCKYHAVDEKWQHDTCQLLGLNLVKINKNISPGTKDMPLTRPDMRKSKAIVADGNCMFRALSHIVTGSQSQHAAVRGKIIHHIEQNTPPNLVQHVQTRYKGCESGKEYVQKSSMAVDETWGTDIELLSFAHLTKIVVFSYNREKENWGIYTPRDVDRRISADYVGTQSMYLILSNRHYTVVGGTVKVDPATAAEAEAEEHNLKDVIVIPDEKNGSTNEDKAKRGGGETTL